MLLVSTMMTSTISGVGQRAYALSSVLMISNRGPMRAPRPDREALTAGEISNYMLQNRRNLRAAGLPRGRDFRQALDNGRTSI